MKSWLAAFGLTMFPPMRSVAAGDCDGGLMTAQGGDFKLAINLWRLLAEQGNVDAQYNLGIAYTTGQSVLQDVVGAVTWFGEAAQQGDATVQRTGLA